jgi:hypothetical protein
MDHEIQELPIKIQEIRIKTDQTPIKIDQPPIELDKERIKLVKEYYGRHYKYVVNLIEQKDINNESIVDDFFFAELARIPTNIFSSYVEEHIIEKGILVDISEFRFENQVRAIEKDYRYLLQIKHKYNYMLHEKVKKLLEYAIDNDNKIIEKLCAHKTDKTDNYSIIRGEYDIRAIFSTIKSSKMYVKKCIERYPKSVKYLIESLQPYYTMWRQDKYEIELLEYAIELDGSCIQYHNDPSYELCKKAVRSNPKAILQICHKGKYINNKKANIKTELKTLKNLAIELDPFLIEYPEMRSHDRKIMAESYKRRYWLDKMFDLCVSLHELDLPDEIVYEIYDSLYPNHTLILFELWNVTRIVKKQELRLSKFKEM